MRKKPYFPKTDAALTSWTTNFETGISVPANATAMGFTAADVTALINAGKAIRLALADVANKEAAFKSAVIAKNAQVATSGATIRSYVKRGKTTSTYTEALGQSLGVVGDDSDVMDWANFSPLSRP